MEGETGGQAAPLCEEKAELLLANQKAADAYVHAIRKLADRRLTPAENDLLTHEIEQARSASLEARRKLSKHTAAHRC